MAKTIHEKITNIDEKMAQYANQKKQLLQQQKEAERKARTHRLIERGALVEGLMDVDGNATNEQIREVVAIALNSDAGRKALFSLREQIAVKPDGAAEAPPGAGA